MQVYSEKIVVGEAVDWNEVVKRTAMACSYYATIPPNGEEYFDTRSTSKFSTIPYGQYIKMTVRTSSTRLAYSYLNCNLSNVIVRSWNLANRNWSEPWYFVTISCGCWGIHYIWSVYPSVVSEVEASNLFFCKYIFIWFGGKWLCHLSM